MSGEDSPSVQQYDAQFYTIDSNKTINDTLEGITDLMVLAHPDDAEIAAPDVIDECRKDPTRKLGVVIVTDGQGAGRKGEYADFTNADMAAERLQEQVRAAMAGKYEFLSMLGEIDKKSHPVDENSAAQNIYAIMRNCPNLERVITHNPFDHNGNHRNVMSATIGAINMLPPEMQDNIRNVRGAEIWKEISWVGSQYIMQIPLTEDQMHLQTSVLGIHQSQTIGSQNYIPAVLGRQRARATFESGPHRGAPGLLLALDLSSLIGRQAIPLEEYVGNVLHDHEEKMRTFTDTLTPPTQIPPESTAREFLRAMPRITVGGRA